MDKFVTRKQKEDTSVPSTSTAVSDTKSSSELDSEPETENLERVGTSKILTKKKAYKQKYTNKWQEIDEFQNWLIEKNEKPHCIICKKFISGGITHIKRHSESIVHKKLVNAAKNTPKISDKFIGDKARKLRENVRSGELKMVMFLAEHNLPFAILDHLTKLFSSICVDSEIAKSLECSRTKGTQLCINTIAPTSLELTCNDLKKSYFSLIVDETTDVSTSKCLAVVVRYFKEITEDKFLGLVEVKDSTAEGLYIAIKTLLTDNNIPMSNMVGFAADNAAVMMGQKGGLQTKLKADNPNIFVLGCVCHSFHLAASSACLKIPKSIEDLARDICNYFAHSSKRVEQLKECQVFAQLKPHKMLRMSQTRWLSLQNVVNRILEQWPALILTFTAAVEEDKLVATQTILSALKNDLFKLYFNFLSYVLGIVNKLNAEFQSESPKLYLLTSRIEELYKTILRNFIKASVISKFNSDLNKLNVKDPNNFLPLEKLYLGANCEILINKKTVSEREIKQLKIRCLDFYQELCFQILKRFKFNDPILNFMKILDPTVAISGKIPSIVDAMELFPNVVQVSDLEELNSEWRLLPDIEVLKSCTESLENFWKKVFQMKNSLNLFMFPKLSKLIKALLALPHSSATAERIFSTLNLIKSKTRNRLNTETCNALILTKQLLAGQECYKFDPLSRLLKDNLAKTKTIEEDIDITF